MSYTHTCKTCGLVITYEKPEELKPHFYFKGGYWRRVCIKCELAERAKKYASGEYNYRNREEGVVQCSFGHNNRVG